jgi:hypothetical protein
MLDQATDGPLGPVVERAFQLARRKNAGFPLPPAETLPADVVMAVEILAEEERGYLEERHDREETADAVRRELGKKR